MAVPAHRLTATGIAGAGVGFVLGAALTAFVLTAGTPFGWLIWLVLYPLGPLVGYDLATRGGIAGDGGLLRLGGYSVAVAAAHLAVAAGYAVGVGAGVDRISAFWAVPLACCVVAAVPARTAAVRIGRGLHGSHWALIGAAAFIGVVAWLLFVVAAGFQLGRVDS